MNKDPFQVPLIQCCAVTKVFKEKAQHTVVLRDINFTLYPRERVAIVGTSGSGKSTLLHLLSCLDHVTTGDIRILEHPVTQYSPQQLNYIRNQYLGFVYQFHHLLPEFSLFENIALPLLIQKKPKQLIQEIVHDMLKKLGLTHRAHHRPSEISGGERQRVAIGRAIITQPRLILADEPTGNLDDHTAHQIIELLCSIEEAGMVIVTHDMSIAKCMNKILRLENGRLIPEVMPELD